MPGHARILDVAVATEALQCLRGEGRAPLGHPVPADGGGDPAERGLAHIAGASRPAAFAAVVRHLLADPVLPPALLPADWPGAELRAAYGDHQRELTGDVRARVHGA